MNTATMVNVGGLLVFLIGQTLVAVYVGRITRQLTVMAKGFRDGTTAMVIDLHDALTRFELLVKEMRSESDAERGRDAAPTPPNLPRLSGPARHAADPSGEWTGMPLREALHENKAVLPAIVEECYVCHCNVAGWSGPHCHYHGASVPGTDRCLYLGMEAPH